MLEGLLYCLGFIAAFAILHVLAWYQATWDMTEEQKDKLLEYISENGFYGGDDWP